MAKDTKRPRSGGSSSGKSGSSLLAGLLVGLAIGITAAVAVVFYVNRSANPFMGKPSTPSAPAAEQPPATQAPEVLRPTSGKDDAPVIQNASSASAGAARNASGIELDFYKILPGLNDKTGANTKPAENAKPTASTPAKIAAAKGTWLQAGAFQNEQDADNLKAKLAMLGIESRIQTQDIPGKGLWHRVRIGPLGTPGDIDKTRSQLQANGIETVVVKAE